MPITIDSIKCHKIINSRGEWTIETRVLLSDGSVGEQSVPDGASKGENEAVYVPVDKAIDIVSSAINDLLTGKDPFNQHKIDNIMLEVDGTPNKSSFGGNSILSVSLAVAKACAKSKQLELYEYLAELAGSKLDKNNLSFPVPVFNILNGGKHANNGLSFQEFMIIPAPNLGISDSLEIGLKVYENLKYSLELDGFFTGVGDEGGFAPQEFTVSKALEYIKLAVSKDYVVGKDVFFGMDVAAESFYDNANYNIKEQNLALDSEKLKNYYADLLKKYEIIYLEDPFYEGDVQGWQKFYSEFNDKLMIVADDLVVTNPKFLKNAINNKLANAVIVKPNQVGTLSETLKFIQMAKAAKMTLIISHRSGDTAEDTFIADLAVGVGADFMKSGAPTRGERIVKYNRLLDIRDNFV